jgi:hypothetical protein
MPWEKQPHGGAPPMERTYVRWPYLTPRNLALFTVGGPREARSAQGDYVPPTLGAGQSPWVADRRNDERDPATGVLVKGTPGYNGRAPLGKSATYRSPKQVRKGRRTTPWLQKSPRPGADVSREGRAGHLCDGEAIPGLEGNLPVASLHPAKLPLQPRL